MDKLELIHDYIVSLASQLSDEYDLQPSETNNERIILVDEIYREIINIIKEDNNDRERPNQELY